MKTIEMLINEIKTSEALQKLLAEAVKNNALAAFLKEQGCEATAEEFIAALKAPAGELDDDALGGLATNAFDHLEQLVVARSNDIAQFIGVKGRKDGTGGIATYARHGDELKEELALALVGKAVKDIGIFADSLIDV